MDNVLIMMMVGCVCGGACGVIGCGRRVSRGE